MGQEPYRGAIPVEPDAYPVAWKTMKRRHSVALIAAYTLLGSAGFLIVLLMITAHGHVVLFGGMLSAGLVVARTIVGFAVDSVSCPRCQGRRWKLSSLDVTHCEACGLKVGTSKWEAKDP
jgi:hypothetical protein